VRLPVTFVCGMNAYTFSNRKIIDEDKLEEAFKLIKEVGVNETLEYLLSVTSDSSALIPLQRNFQDVKIGDHLVYKTPSGWKVNFYVVNNLGNGKLCCVSTFLDDDDNPFIEGELILYPKKGKQLKITERILVDTQIPEHADMFKKVYKDVNITISVEKQNSEKFKMNTYDFLTCNSEHFVTFVKTGIAKCRMCKEIEAVFEKYLFVQAIQTDELKRFAPVIRSRSWDMLLSTITNGFTVSAVLKPLGIAGREAGKAVAQAAAITFVKQVSRETLQQTVSASTAQTAKTALLNAAKQSIKASVVLGAVVEGSMYTAQMGNAVYKRVSGKMDHEEFKNYAVECTTMSGGSTLGGIGGSVAGAAVGAAVGSVVPVVGTVTGAFVGSVVGGVAGGLGGTALGKGTGVAINHFRGTEEWNFGCKSPGAIIISPENEFVILDTLASQVLILNCELMLIKLIALHREGLISKPSGIAVSELLIAVGDCRSHLIAIYSKRGDYLLTIENMKRSKENPLDLPLGLCFNSKAVLYVADGCRVHAFDTCKNNTFCGTFGSEGDLKRYHPVSIAVDTNDYVYVTDYHNNCVNMYSVNHHKLLCKIDCNRPCAIAFTPDNHMIAADGDKNCLRVFTAPLRNRFIKNLFKSRKENVYSRQLVNKFGKEGSNKLEFRDICGIGVNKQGTVFVADSKNDCIQIIGTMVWRKARKVKEDE